MNKVGYMLMVMVSQVSFAVSDDYLTQMGKLETEWNEYAPASEKVLELDALVELTSRVGESFAAERLNASNRAKKIGYLQTRLINQESRISYIKNNAKDDKFNLCEVVLDTESSRLELVKLYSEEIAYLADLGARFVKQGDFGLMNDVKTQIQGNYAERSNKIKQAIPELKDVAARKNGEYQANNALHCKHALADIAEQIKGIN